MEFTENNILHIPLLSLITFLPLIGVFILIFIEATEEKLIKHIALLFFGLDFLISLPLFYAFDATSSGIQFSEHLKWYESLGISYHLGIDGISLFLVLLTTFLGPIVMLSSWNSIKTRLKGYVISLLLLQTGMLGAFVSLNLFLFYLFWEAMLIPMYFLIGVWGGPKRIYAAVKFFIYTMVGSLLMLVAILYLYTVAARQGVSSFDLLDLYKVTIPASVQFWMFAAFALAFAIKVPIFPLHTWLPDAHVEAPTAGSVILAGVLLKMGTYGFVRLAMPLFPAVVQQVGLFVLLLAVISIIYGALVAMVQPDLKKLVAYSSVSHLGFVMLGLFMLNAQSVQGAILQMINHGLSTGALFLMVGMLYERRHSRMISDFGGLAKQVPVLASLFLLVTLSSIGLPGTNGFVGEVLILIGSYRQAFMGLASGHFFLIILIMIASLGVVLAAVYMLWMFQRVMFGPIRHEENRHLTDLTLREKVVLLPLLVMIFWIGLYPQPFLSKMEASVKQWNSHMEKKRQTQLIQPMPNRWAESRSASFAGLSHDFFTVTDASAGAAVQSEVTR